MFTLILALLVGVVVGGVFSYLFLRANPNKKKIVDDYTEEQSAKLKK